MFVIAGPNGAGKTTFAREFLPRFANCPKFVNVDLIASGLSPFEPRAAAIEAGKLMLRQINDLGRRKETFGFETTLSGRGIENFRHYMALADQSIVFDGSTRPPLTLGYGTANFYDFQNPNAWEILKRLVGEI